LVDYLAQLIVKAIELVKDLCNLLGKGGFRLTKFTSNIKAVLESIPPQDRAKNVRMLDLTTCASLPTERALGCRWDTELDTLGVKIRQRDPVFTKRGLLKITSSIYDPFGFVGPFVLEAKKIFQDECRANKGWDDDLSTKNVQRWKKWLADLPRLEKFQVPRCLLPVDCVRILSLQLVHFSDASEAAYRAISFLRIVTVGGVYCSFVMAKSRLAPLKQMTIPRLELSAAVVAVKLDTLCRDGN
jgi:hypothetical protein